MTPGTLFIRADASVAIGTGHVMRCLALAQAWQDAGGNVMFALAEATPAIEQRLAQENFEVMRLAVQPGSHEDSLQTAHLAQQRAVSCVVVDGYHFRAEYQRTLKDAGLRILFVDDNGHAASYSADFVLNQNVHASESLYTNRDPQTRLLLGCRYAMLRRDFAPWRTWQRTIPSIARGLLVTVGGSDPANVTRKILESLPAEAGFKITAVVGGSNPHLEDLRTLAARSGRDIHLATDVADMPQLMAASDLAIAAAGTTSWEMCFLGLPAALLVVADNQSEVAKELGRRSVAVDLGWAANVTSGDIASQFDYLRRSPSVRASMSQKGRALVDGRGAERVVSAICDPVLRIRDVERSDCRLLWEWANDPEVRESSFSPAAIPWDDHCHWFQKKLDDPNCRILIAVNNHAAPVGQIRFDRKLAGEAEIDVSLAAAFRGRGMARRLLELGCDAAFQRDGLQKLHALVKSENTASARTFEGVGFTKLGEETVHGQPAIHYVLIKP